MSQDQDIVGEMLALTERTLARITADPELGTIFDGTASQATYVKFLTRTYHYVSETIPQLRAGLKDTESRTDNVSRQLADGFAHHIDEETGHDSWLLADIRAVGGDPEAARRADPGAAVKAYVAWSRFVCKEAPLGVKGFAFVLEHISGALGTRAANNLRAARRIENIEKGLTFLEGHGELDLTHREEARRQIEVIADPRDREAILMTARVTAYLYEHLMIG